MAEIGKLRFLIYLPIILAAFFVFNFKVQTFTSSQKNKKIWTTGPAHFKKITSRIHKSAGVVADKNKFSLILKEIQIMINGRNNATFLHMDKMDGAQI